MQEREMLAWRSEREEEKVEGEEEELVEVEELEEEEERGLNEPEWALTKE